MQQASSENGHRSSAASCQCSPVGGGIRAHGPAGDDQVAFTSSLYGYLVGGGPAILVACP